MSRVLITRQQRFGSGGILRRLAAGREMRTLTGRPTRAAEVRAMPDTGDVQPVARVSFAARDREDETERLDAVAGSEFVDDRIRLLE
jgi:hypothetical protein